MIGFKTIDSYSFDDCVKAIDSYGVDSDEYHEISIRYHKLLRELQEKDDDFFHNCQSVEDYEEYLSMFSTSGFMLYKPRHRSEAIARINQYRKLLEKNRRTKIVNVIFGLLIGILLQRFLPYMIAYLINGDSADWGILGFPISYGIIFVIFLIIRIIKKNISYNRYVAFWGGMVLSCIPMYFYLVDNEVAYGRFYKYGIHYGGENGRVGIANSFGNSIIPRSYDCFYETPNFIIGVIDNSGSVNIDWYTKNDFKPAMSKSFWIVDDSTTSIPLIKAIESNGDSIISNWKYNTIVAVTKNGKELPWPNNPNHNSWSDPEILDLRVIEK